MTNMKPMEGWHRAWFIVGLTLIVAITTLLMTSLLTNPHDPICKVGQVLVYGPDVNDRTCIDMTDFVKQIVP